MALLDSQALQPNFIKLRWLEPYTSAGLNRKTFKSLPRGVYSGFVVKPGPGSFEIQIVHNDPEGYGESIGFSEGNFDPASSGWSIAVHESLQGYNSTVAILHAVGGVNDFVFDLTARAGTTVYAALTVNYQIGVETEGDIRIVEEADLDSDPALINLARIDVPSIGPITDANIIFDDPAYPRVLPFATPFKYGFMSKLQAALLDELATVSGAPAYFDEVIIEVDGPQTVELPGDGLYNAVNGQDLWVFKNGDLKSKNRDYDLVDRGDGYGEEIDYLSTLKEGDIITFRVQQYSTVLTSRMTTLDETALISDNTLTMNFMGSGVTVLPDGANRVKVIIPGGSGGGTRNKFNNTASIIPAFRAVKVLTDNTVELFDPRVSSDNLYGVTAEALAVSGFGAVATGGVLAGALLGVSGNISDDIYVAQDGFGTLTTEAPDATSGQIIRVGFMDGPDATGVTGSGSDLVFDRGRLS